MTMRSSVSGKVFRLAVTLSLFGCCAGHRYYECFPAGTNGTTLLKAAVSDYIANKNGPNSSSAAATVYGPRIGDWCVDRVTSFAQVFQNQKTFSEPLSGWNTSSSTSMAQMFQDAWAFNQDLSNFDTSKVTSMDRMFFRAYAFTGKGLDKWNVAKVTKLSLTFKNATSFHQSIVNWDVRKVNDLSETFRNIPAFQQNLCPWGSKLPSSGPIKSSRTFQFTNCPTQEDPSFASYPAGPLCFPCDNGPVPPAPTPPPTTTQTSPLVVGGIFGWDCFSSASTLKRAVTAYLTQVQVLPTLQDRLTHSLSIQYGYPIGNWCTERVTSFKEVFSNQFAFNEPLTHWNTSLATSMNSMFFKAYSFDQDLSHFVTNRVTDMSSMFKAAYNFTGKGVEKFDTAKVTTMSNMFDSAKSFNADIGGWDVRKVLSMAKMFQVGEKFNRDISKWNISLVMDATSMLSGARAFNQSLCAWGSRLPNTTKVDLMFYKTSCPFQNNDPMFTLMPPGPFCYDCCCRATLYSTIDPPVEVPLVPVAASALPDGRVLAWSSQSRYKYGGGGSVMGTFTTIFDPRNNTSTMRRVEETKHDMFCPGTATLSDGRILVTGGQTSIMVSIYNPWNDTWAMGPKMHIGRGYQAQTTLADGSVFVFGGSWIGGLGGKNGEVYTEQPSGNWTWKSGIQVIDSVQTNDTGGIFRSDSHMWLFQATNGKVFHAGPAKRMHWIDLSGDGNIVQSVLRGDDKDSMNGNAVMFDLNKIFTVGGAENYDSGPASNRAYIIDISGTEAVVQRQSNMLWPRTFCSSVVLPNGMIVVTGGQRSVALFSDRDGVLPVEMFNPATGRFYELKQPLKIPRNYHSVGLLLKDGRVLVGGGGLCGNACDYSTSYNHPNFEIINPPYLFDSKGRLAKRPVMSSAQSSFSPGGSINVTMDTTSLHNFSLMRTGTATHAVNLDQRRVPLTVTQQNGKRFTLKIPTSPVHVAPGVYWLFAMNGAGTPSTGLTMLRL